MGDCVKLYASMAVATVVFLSPYAAHSEDAQFPIVIEHALGTTTIPKKPLRVASVGWANHEVPLALGIVPVGMAAAWWGDDDGDGILPWVAKALEDLDAGKPVLFDEGDGIDFEAVAATNPDVILAVYSGISQTDYDTLSEIAPVVGYTAKPWTSDWREMITLNSKALGLESEGKALISDIESKIATEVAKHPEIKGKSGMFITHLDPTDLSTVNFYSANDTRVKFFEDLGMSSPKSVKDASKDGVYSGSISAERVDMFNDVDIVVTYGSAELIAAITANPLLTRMPAVEHGSIVSLGNNPVGATASPTPLSISWTLSDYLDLLAAAAKKAE